MGVPTLLSLSPEQAVAAAGSMATGAAVFAELYQFARQSQVERSKHALDRATQGLEAAYNQFLADPPTRESWIHAARVLGSCLEVGEHITETDHKITWDQQQFLWRFRYRELLERPVEFFFGLEGGDTTRTDFTDGVLGQLAERARRTDHYALQNLRGSITYGVEHEEAALLVVLDFVAFPQSYDDPLDRVPRLTKAKYRKLESENLPLFAFLNWRRRVDVTGLKPMDGSKPRPRDDESLPDH